MVPASLSSWHPRASDTKAAMRLLWVALGLILRQAAAYDESACAADISGMINDLTVIGVDIQFTLPDCTPTGFSVLDCTNDIIPVIQNAADFSKLVSKSTFSCGNVDNGCSLVVSEALTYAAKAAAAFVATVSNCNASSPIPTPLTCAVQVFTAADSLVYFAIKIHQSLVLCNPTFQPGISFDDPLRQRFQNVALQSITGRRLVESVRSISDSLKQVAADRLIHAGIPQSRLPAGAPRELVDLAYKMGGNRSTMRLRHVAADRPKHADRHLGNRSAAQGVFV